MDFSLSTEQDILKRSAREFLAAEWKFEHAEAMARDERGCPAELWQKIADLGWTMLPFPEEYGGTGSSVLDFIVLLEEMGRVNFPPLYFNAMVGGLAILAAGSEKQKEDLLPAIAAGEQIATLAWLEQSMSYDPSGIQTAAMRNRAGEYSITGTKLFVPDVHLADHIVTVARTGERGPNGEGISLLLFRANGGKAVGLSTTRLNTLVGDKQYEVVFDGAKVQPEDVLGGLDQAWPALEKVMAIAAIGKCAEMVGAGQRSLDLSVEQGHNRIQFGRPIGSFQAIQHHCANIVTEVDLSRFMTYQAAWMLSEGMPCTREVSLAKSFVGDSYLRVCALAHQVLGGNGLIVEHEMPLFSNRAPAGQQFFGSSDYHREAAVRTLGL